MTRACTLIASIVTASLLAGTASAQAPTRPEILQPEQMFETLRKLMDQMKPQIDDALNEFAWSLEARDDLHATARYRRDLVRRLGRKTIEEARKCVR